MLTKRKILFVDDEPQLLKGLQGRLRRKRKQWDMHFALGAQAALKALATEPFDVIVSDMRMPGINGAQLLDVVQTAYPKTVRIVLSGSSELDVVMQALPVAHQYVAKPCDADKLETTVERTCRLRSLLDDAELRQVVGRIGTLPPAPRLYTKLTRMLADDRTSLSEVAAVIEQDVALTAQLLHTVNSAFFRLAKRISRVDEAVTYLGTESLKHIVLALEVYGVQKPAPVPGFSLAALQDHSLRTAQLASRLLEGGQADDAFTAGVLHDVGKLVFAQEMPKALGEVIVETRTAEKRGHEVELDRLGADHAGVGGYLLGLWGLPFLVVESVAHHHDPGRVEVPAFDALFAVHVADLLAEDSEAELDLSLLEQIGVHNEVEGWRKLAREVGRVESEGGVRP